MSRSKWKGPFLDKSILLLKKSTNPHKIWSRRSMISNVLIGRKVLIYNGKDFRPLTIQEKHVGFKFGELSFTTRKIQKKEISVKNKKQKK